MKQKIKLSVCVLCLCVYIGSKVAVAVTQALRHPFYPPTLTWRHKQSAVKKKLQILNP